MTDSEKPAGGAFPLTRLSAIVAAGSADHSERSRGLDILAAAYWTPVYKYIRIKWNKQSDDARELTQGNRPAGFRFASSGEFLRAPKHLSNLSTCIALARATLISISTHDVDALRVSGIMPGCSHSRVQEAAISC